MNTPSGLAHRAAAIPLLAFFAGVLLLVSGCGTERQHAEVPNRDLQLQARPEHERPIAPPPSTGVALQGPRPQSEIDKAYQLPALPPVTSTCPIPAPIIRHDAGIVAESGWDVPITREWSHIVVHHSASTIGSAAAFDRAHRERGWDGLGYHFVIGNGHGSGNGQVEVGYRWKGQIQGAHAGNAEYNQHGIGICLVGDFEHVGPPTQEQMESLTRLVRFLQVKTGIQTSEVIGHGNVPGKNTDCPGKYLDMNAFRASLGSGAIGVPIHVVQSPYPSSAPSRSARTASTTAYRSGAALP